AAASTRGRADLRVRATKRLTSQATSASDNVIQRSEDPGNRSSSTPRGGLLTRGSRVRILAVWAWAHRNAVSVVSRLHFARLAASVWIGRTFQPRRWGSNRTIGLPRLISLAGL